jgi:hypothetical protein
VGALFEASSPNTYGKGEIVEKCLLDCVRDEDWDRENVGDKMIVTTAGMVALDIHIHR